jgi:mono/diheme cytochrome c family protein
VKIPTALFVGLLSALMLVAGLLSLTAAQTSGRKNSDLVISSMAGRDLFEFYCASCHGRDGKGGGHTVPALKVPPPDLTTLTERNHGTFPSARVESVIKGEQRLSTPPRLKRHAGVGTDLQGARQP